MNVADNLRRLREAKGLSKEELARRAGVSGAMVSYLERGTRNMSLNLAADFAKVLDCSVSDFMAGTQDDLLKPEEVSG